MQEDNANHAPDMNDLLAAFRTAVLAVDQMADVRLSGPPGALVPVRLVPVEVFGGDCRCHEDRELAAGGTDCHGFAYGLSDAVSAWSDCNRARGRIYRRDDDETPRNDGDTITVWVAVDEMAKFEERFGDEFGRD